MGRGEGSDAKAIYAPMQATCPGRGVRHQLPIPRKAEMGNLQTWPLKRGAAQARHWGPGRQTTPGSSAWQ